MSNSNKNRKWYEKPRPINNGFWDRDAEDRSARMEAACEKYGVANFWDLSPEERSYAYETVEEADYDR